MAKPVTNIKFSIVAGLLLFCIFWTIPLAVFSSATQSTNERNSVPGNKTTQWYSRDKSNKLQIDLYFFWSWSCPHCLEARPVMQSLSKKHPWIKLHSLEITRSIQNALLYQSMATELKQDAASVPVFLFCGVMQVGLAIDDPDGKKLLKQMNACRSLLLANKAIADYQKEYRQQNDQQLNLPLVGKLDLNKYSLATVTVILAGLDAFNPCAFFVLLFLLSMLVHARSRTKILLVGGIFVFISGLMYFLFMSAWLNIFMFVGKLAWITLIAGLIALTIALINIKDYFWFKKGLSLSIPDAAKPGLFNKMHNLLDSRRMSTMIAGAAALAMFANLYEFLCTVGFPMVFTRILTMEEISVSQYYSYLVLYNVIYILPLATIVIIFAVTLGRRKLQEHEGRVMKLLSGMMMLFLGSILLFAPEMLNQMLTALILLGLAIFSTWLIVKVGKFL